MKVAYVQTYVDCTYILKYQGGRRDREENLMTANENIREISSLQGLLVVVCYALANMMMNLISA